MSQVTSFPTSYCNWDIAQMQPDMGSMSFFPKEQFLYSGEGTLKFDVDCPCITSGMYFIQGKFSRSIGEAVLVIGKAINSAINSLPFKRIRYSGSPLSAPGPLIFTLIIPLQDQRIYLALLSTTAKPVTVLRSRISWAQESLQGKRKELMRR